MSGAQGKAARICGVVGIIAEVNPAATKKRYEQGWVDVIIDDIEEVIRVTREAQKEKKAIAIAYEGNIVDLFEGLLAHDLIPELGSDQTSLHNPFNGGYYPAGLTLEESNAMMANDPEQF